MTRLVTTRETKDESVYVYVNNTECYNNNIIIHRGTDTINPRYKYFLLRVSYRVTLAIPLATYQ